MENEAIQQPGVDWYDFRVSIYPRTIVSQELEAKDPSSNVCVPFAVPLTCHRSAFMHTPLRTGSSLIFEGCHSHLWTALT